MKRIGKITKTTEGKFQLQYWLQEDRLYEVEESSSTWKTFDTLREAIDYVRKNRIVLEKKENFGDTVSFACPNCQKKGELSWTHKLERGGFLCHRCGSTYSSYESARTILEE